MAHTCKIVLDRAASTKFQTVPPEILGKGDASAVKRSGPFRSLLRLQLQAFPLYAHRRRDDASAVANGARAGDLVVNVFAARIDLLRGRGDVTGEGRLDLELVDNVTMPGKDDVVTTWGSKTHAPYVPGIPIGTVESVYSSPRQHSKQAVIRPLVDFSSLDLVGVVVNDDTPGSIIKAGELP